MARMRNIWEWREEIDKCLGLIESAVTGNPGKIVLHKQEFGRLVISACTDGMNYFTVYLKENRPGELFSLFEFISYRFNTSDRDKITRFIHFLIDNNILDESTLELKLSE